MGFNIFLSFVPIVCVCILLIHTANAQSTEENTTEPQPAQAGVANVIFQDVISGSGLTQPRSRKFGGPHVSDLDGDGIYDVVLSVHNRGPLNVFFGNGGGTFSRGNFVRDTDIHGVSSAPRTVFERTKLFTISYGGARGTNVAIPGVVRVDPGRSMTDVSSEYGLGKMGGRGRNVIFMDLSLESQAQRKENLGGPDVIFMNFLGNLADGLMQFAYKNVRGSFVLTPIPGLNIEPRARAELTDIDGDGRMEIVSIRLGIIYKLTAPFRFADVSNQVLGGQRIQRNSGAAAAELDFDNDGDFDLYWATGDVSTLSEGFYPSTGPQSDRLYENRNGRYVDVSRQAGIPQGTNSMGVTTGDFNNDGFVDILVVLHREPDMVLLNQGDGTFRRVNGLIPKSGDTVGDHAVAVDYNLDGRVDAFVGHGGQEGPPGFFKLMKNLIQLDGSNKYLLVRVGNAPSRAALALHAKLTIRDGSTTLTRRVGSPGAQNGGQCYLDTVHFGVGSRATVNLFIRWSDGSTEERFNVPTNSKISVGFFP